MSDDSQPIQLSVEHLLSQYAPDPLGLYDYLWLPEGVGPIRLEPMSEPFEHELYRRGQSIQVRMQSRDWDEPHVGQHFWVSANFISAYRLRSGCCLMQVWVHPTVHLGDGWDLIPGKVDRYFEQDIRVAP